MKFAQSAIVEKHIPEIGRSGQGKNAGRKIFIPLSAFQVCRDPGSDDVGFAMSGMPSRYLGDLVAVAGACDAWRTSLLVRNGLSVMFLPDAGVISLNGHLSPGGKILAVRQMRDVNHTPYQLAFAGHMTESHILGTYVTPRCRYTVELHAVRE